MATREHRGFWSSFQYVTLVMGQLLALMVLIALQQLFLSEDQLHAWGAEYVALWFKNAGVESGFYWYVTACIGVSLLVYLWMPETQRTSRIDREMP